MNEPRSSRIGWYRVSGFFDAMAYMDEMRTMIKSTRAKTALYTKKITPITPVTISYMDIRSEHLSMWPWLTYRLVEDRCENQEEDNVEKINSGD